MRALRQPPGSRSRAYSTNEGSTFGMCSGVTWGAVSVHYLLGLPLAYALCGATPTGRMLLVKLTYSPVLLRPIESSYLPRCSFPSTSIWFAVCFLLSLSLSRHTLLLYPTPFVYVVAVSTRFIAIPRASFAAGVNRICMQYGYSPLVSCKQLSNVLSYLVLHPPVSAFHYLFGRLIPDLSCLLLPRIPCRLR